MSGYDSFPPGFKSCIPFFLASILYHLPTLQRWFPDPHHDIWSMKVFGVFGEGMMERLLELRKGVVVESSEQCSECTMRATGIPAETRMLLQLKGVTHRLGNVDRMLEERMRERGIHKP